MPFGVDAPLSSGENVALVCSVKKGDTPLNITWAFNGGPVSEALSVRVIPTGTRSSFLSVESVGAAHSGLYTCTAANAVGSASHTARITVKGQWWSRWHSARYREPCIRHFTIWPES